MAEILPAINCLYGKSDYIPCIAWGRSAGYLSGFEAGTPVSVKGRIQSREYTKKLSDAIFEKRVAYEVSTSRIGDTRNVVVDCM